MLAFTLPKDSDHAIIYDEANRKQYLIERYSDEYLVITPIFDEAIIKAVKERYEWKL